MKNKNSSSGIVVIALASASLSCQGIPTFPSSDAVVDNVRRDTRAPGGSKVLAVIGGVRVFQDGGAVFWKHGLNVDADGAPRAYSPVPGRGLDYLADAGHPGNWWGIVTSNGSPSGKPIVQGESDPAPGFYVSDTSLHDPSYPRTNPERWVDASRIPFIVLPEGRGNFGGALGDFAAVMNLKTGKIAYAIAADEGPKNKIGEGSVALARALRVPSSAKHGGVGDGIAYIFFPGSGNGRPRSQGEIDREGARLFRNFGGGAGLVKKLGIEGE